MLHLNVSGYIASRLECDAELVKSVYKAAALFKMHGAAEACSRFLADNLTVQNCLGRSFLLLVFIHFFEELNEGKSF